MNKQEFDYEACKNALDVRVPVNDAQLPPEILKSKSLRKINKSMREYTLPVLYRYTPVSTNAILSIQNEDVYMVPASSLNDVFEGAPYGTNSPPAANIAKIKKIQESIYVKSFSCEANNNLMWSHYGDSHKGICVGYDFSLLQSRDDISRKIVNHLYPVQYSDTRFSHENSENIAIHSFLYLRKSKCWAYEKEFRLLYKKRELPCGEQNIALNCIKEIQFGLRMPEDQKRLVAELVRAKNAKSNKKIKLFETKLKDDRFELERRKYV